MPSKSIITYGNKRTRNATKTLNIYKTATPGPAQLDDAGAMPNAPLQSLDSMKRRMLKRSRDSFQEIQDTSTVIAQALQSAYMDQLPLETPLPTAYRLSETFQLPSGVGQRINPEDFSPMPRMPVRIGERRTVSEADVSLKIQPISAGNKSKKIGENGPGLSRTKSGNLKENSRSSKTVLASMKKSRKSIQASRTSSSKTGENRSTKNRPLSRPCSRSSFTLPLSSPFNSQPPSAANSPKAAQLPERQLRPVQSKDGDFKYPLRPKIEQNSDRYPAYGSQSTTTSPAHSAICAGSPLGTEIVDNQRIRRPSAPSATRPIIFGRETTQSRSRGERNWAPIGVSFDRPPSQLDYTHTYSDSYYLGGCDIEGLDADLLRTSPPTSTLATFWDGAQAISTPYDKDRHRDDENLLAGNADDGNFDEASVPLNDAHILPLASAPGYKTPELQPLPSSGRPYLRSFFSDDGVGYSPAKEFHSPRSGNSYYASPRVKGTHGTSASSDDDIREVTAAARSHSEDLGLAAEVEVDDGMSWLSDSLISPPTALVRRLAQTERYKRRFPASRMKERSPGDDTVTMPIDDGTMDMELDSRSIPLPQQPLAEKTSCDSLDDIFKSVNISLGSLEESEASVAVPADGTQEHVDVVPATLNTHTARDVSSTTVASSPRPKGRSRRGTIKASDYPTVQTAGTRIVSQPAITQRTRSGTITARSISLGETTIGNSVAPSASGIGRRTRSGTIVGPPSAPRVSVDPSARPKSDRSTKTFPAAAEANDPIDLLSDKRENAVNDSSNLNVLSPPREEFSLAPPIDLDGEVWQVAPRVSPEVPKKTSCARNRVLGLGSLRTSSSRIGSDAPRMRVVQPICGGPRGGARGVGTFGKLSTMKSLTEDERSSDDELLLKPGIVWSTPKKISGPNMNTGTEPSTS
ncbi:hypothetical protein ONZ45_g12353 [Pleurotus djamor]|nr:hypothetical protein ONZ45_g12353 [Pleurotus djamor]